MDAMCYQINVGYIDGTISIETYAYPLNSTCGIPLAEGDIMMRGKNEKGSSGILEALYNSQKA